MFPTRIHAAFQCFARLAPVVVLTLASTASPADPELQKQFERAAGNLEFFSWGDFLYDREETSFVMPRQAAERHDKTLRQLFSRAHPKAALVDLLQHPDSKVRTLAMAGLFATEDPQALPHLAALVTDNAPSFPRPLMLAVMLGQAVSMPPMQPQTVGDIARAMVRFYMERSGMFDPVEGREGEGGFAAYWAARKDRRYCAGWFEVRLDRATQGMFPIAAGRLWKIHELQREIDLLPPVDRELTLLAVFHERKVRDVVGPENLLYAARRLGPDRLMKVLAGERLSDDPDLTVKNERIQQYVLSQATRLLRSSDAAALLELARQACRAPWFIAGAELQPTKASGILHEALDRCKLDGEGRAAAAQALRRLAGAEESRYLIGWFHTDRDPVMGRAPYRAGFAEFLLERFEPEDRALLAAIVGDPRFEQLDWPTLKAIVEGLNRNLLHPVADPRQVEDSSHPLGEMHFDGMLDRAWKEYPKETKKLLATLAEWRRGVRESLPRWAASSPPK